MRSQYIVIRRIAGIVFIIVIPKCAQTCGSVDIIDFVNLSTPHTPPLLNLTHFVIMSDS